MRYLPYTLAVILGGCASSASQETQAPRPDRGPIKLPADTGRGSTNQTTTYGCDSRTSDSSQFGLFDEGRVRLNGHEIFVSTGRGGDKLSLCEVLNRSGKEAVFFQFAGVTCEECQDKSNYYSRVINSSRYRDIAWVVVITDHFSDGYTESDFQGYMDTYAPDAMRVHDEAKLWKALSENPSAPIRSTAFTMNRNMDVVVVNRPGTEEQAILDAAVRLVDEVKNSRND